MKKLEFILNSQLLTDFIINNEFIKSYCVSLDIQYHFIHFHVVYVTISLFIVDKNDVSIIIKFVINESSFHLHIEDMQQSINDILAKEIILVKSFYSFD